MEPAVINESDLTPAEIRFLRSQGFVVKSEEEQGSPEWEAARLGKVTASRIHDVVARNRYDKPYASYETYKLELLMERLTGNRKRFSSKPMEWGRAHEEEAAELYEQMTGSQIRECGFIEHPDFEGEAGASPDRLVDDEGLVEIKCPNTITHLGYLMVDKPPENYYDQMQWQMACSGRKWCDWMSYDLDLPENLQVVLLRVQRDDDYISDMIDKLRTFLEELQKAEKWMREYNS